MRFEKLWFQEEQDKSHDNLVATVREIMIRQSYREIENLQHFKMYINGSSIDDFARNYVFSSKSGGMYINLSQRIISTLLSKIARNKPKPTFLTEDGDWDKQEQAKGLDRFMIGQFYKSKVYETTQKTFLHSCIFGTGLSHVYNDGKNCLIENVLASEILADDRECLLDKPQNLYRVKSASKVSLIARFPKFKKEIMESKTLEQTGYYFGNAVGDDNVTVVEAWHLPDQNGENGRHVLAIEGATLLDKEWKRKYFPFPKFKFQERAIGFYGRGVCELINNIQLEANKLYERIRNNIHLTTVPRVLYDYSSKIVKSKFNNEIGSLIGYLGTAPQFITPSGVAPELFEWLKMQIQFAFEEIGVSELSASSQKPAGLNSGAAIREFSDIESDRFSNLQQRWEDYHLVVSDMMIDEISELAESENGYSVLAVTKEGNFNIKWKDVNLDRDSYVMQTYPTSLLPTHPAGRLATVTEMVSEELIDRADALDLLDYPDIKKYINFETAPKQDIMATISSILKGNYVAPEIFQDLDNGIRMMQYAYLFYKHKGVKQGRLDLFRQWISDASEIIGEASQALQQQAPQMQSAPTGQFETVPTNNLEGTSMQGEALQ